MPSLTSSPAREFFTMPFRKRKYTINPPDEVHNVIYLGNVLTIMGKGEQSIEKPLALIWKAYCAKQQRHDISMKLMITRSGLKAETKLQGLTEYWAHRVTFCSAPADYPKVFCWVYKHDGKKMKPELRCHAVLCKKSNEPSQIAVNLTHYLQNALAEYKREKICIEKARKVSAQAGGHGLGPRRKLLLQSGSLNFRPPVSRSKSAPRLGSIDEEDEVEEPIQQTSDQENIPEIHIDDDETFYYDHRSTPIGDDVCSNSSIGSSMTNSVKAEEEEEFSPMSYNFKRNLSMNSATKRRHQSLPHSAKQVTMEELASHLESACIESKDDKVEDEEISEEDDEVNSTSDNQQAQSSSCASSDDGFASSCQSGDLDQMHMNQRASLRRRMKVMTDPDTMSDESGYNEAGSRKESTAKTSTSRQSSTSRSADYSDGEDEDEEELEFEQQRKAALTAQRLLGQPATIELEPNVQITAL